MPPESFDTQRLHRCVERWQAGDPEGANELLGAVGQRLEHIARKMLRRFQTVRDRADTTDVLQGSVLRLLKTLRQFRPESTRHFFNLAALHVRRELFDLSRRFRGERLAGEAAAGPTTGETGPDLVQSLAAPEDDDLDLWCRFHEAVAELPSEEREVVELTFYHGWTQVQIAELLEVNERTVRRRWQSGCLRLNELVGDELPQP